VQYEVAECLCVPVSGEAADAVVRGDNSTTSQIEVLPTNHTIDVSLRRLFDRNRIAYRWPQQSSSPVMKVSQEDVSHQLALLARPPMEAIDDRPDEVAGDCSGGSEKSRFPGFPASGLLAAYHAAVCLELLAPLPCTASTATATVTSAAAVAAAVAPKTFGFEHGRPWRSCVIVHFLYSFYIMCFFQSSCVM
jgi:hypothetical protein